MKKIDSSKILIISLMSFFNLFSCQSNEITKDDKFWIWFSKNEKNIYENVDKENLREDIYDQISAEISKIDENLVFEIAPIQKDGKREFSISADGILESFPKVETLISKRPKLNNWNFTAFRQRIAGDDLEINYMNYKIGYDDIFYRFSTENNQLGIELNIRNYDETGDMQNAIYLLLDSLLGEYDVTKNIDWIEWNKLNESEINNLYQITDLRELIDSRKKK